MSGYGDLKRFRKTVDQITYRLAVYTVDSITAADLTAMGDMLTRAASYTSRSAGADAVADVLEQNRSEVGAKQQANWDRMIEDALESIGASGPSRVADDHDRTLLQPVLDFLNNAGLVFADIPPTPLGQGVAVGWGDTFFVVISVGTRTESQFSITSGILRDVEVDQTRVLRFCNLHNQDLAAYPVLLHDAQSGWDILQRTVLPMTILADHPEFVLGWHLDNVTAIAENLRSKAEDARIGGSPYRWGEADRARLLLRSVV